MQKAIECYEQGLEIVVEIGDRRSEGKLRRNLGMAYVDAGEPEKGLPHFEQGLEIARELHNQVDEGVALANLGDVYNARGDKERAQDYWR